MRADNMYHEEYTMMLSLKIKQLESELEKSKSEVEELKRKNTLLKKVIYKVRFTRNEANKIIYTCYHGCTRKQIKRFSNSYRKRLLKAIIGEEYPYSNFKSR